MTSEPWLPIPYDDAPYESALGETPSQASSGLTADGASPSALGETLPEHQPPLVGRVSPSAPANPAATADAAPPAGALTFHCAACILDHDEPWCWMCGANLTRRN